ncbi:hypothetical protein RchiOBHm_Chr1g0347781 [Rosa chinensis]|uniref:Uncharacterized protein n=1 Tax=Rosa chinensis TaxID=74649 RepID=A0A2P6SFD3_ROSCH|nr:hypothetical protein RchiOBHm_Chr1g0347781 [Rosa chinensis]
MIPFCIEKEEDLRLGPLRSKSTQRGIVRFCWEEEEDLRFG